MDKSSIQKCMLLSQLCFYFFSYTYTIILFYYLNYTYNYLNDTFIILIQDSQMKSNMQDLGVKTVRLCSQKQVSMLNQLYSFVRNKYITQTFTQIVRYNIYVDGIYFLNKQEKLQQIAQVLKQMISQLHNEKQVNIGSMGFLISAADHKSDQKFHVEYDDPRIRSLFIPLVPITTANSTQFLKIFPKTIADLKILRKDQQGLLEVFKPEGIISLEIHSLVCDAFTILDMPQSTIHRGVANRSGRERPMFFVNYSFDKNYKTPKAWFDKFLDKDKLKEAIK